VINVDREERLKDLGEATNLKKQAREDRARRIRAYAKSYPEESVNDIARRFLCQPKYVLQALRGKDA